MKNQHIILATWLAIGGFMLNSCDDFLDVKSESSYNEEVVFAQESLTEDVVMSVYSWYGSTNSHRGRYMPYYGMNTDSEYFNNLNNVSDAATSLATYSAEANNNTMVGGSNPNSYTCFYNAIESANICIEGIRKYGKPETNTLMAYFLGEVLTLRAHYYYDLIRAWGDVPARFESVKANTIFMKKSDRDIIYKQIIADLKEAADMLPWPNETERTQTNERVNKAFALGLRARLILMASGYAQRPNSLDDKEGSTIRRSNDPELTSDALLREAYNDLKSIISSGKCHLVSDYNQLWDNLCKDKISFSENNGENIFEIGFNDGRGRFLMHWGVCYTNDKSNPHYQRNGFQGGQNCPTPTLYYAYDESDLRRDINMVPYKWNNGGYTLERLDIANTQANPSFNFGRYDYNRMDRTVTSNDDGINLPVLRYADVLLMAAELANELGELDAAKGYLKEVRNRAFAPTDRARCVDNYLSAINNKAAMLKAIQDERLFEFPGECLRKQDLIRWNKLGETVKATAADIKALHNRTGKYADVPTVVNRRKIGNNGNIEIYGLNRGETATPAGDGWVKLDYDFISEVTRSDLQEHFYAKDPDMRQFWPIFQSDLDASNGALINNYGY